MKNYQEKMLKEERGIIICQWDRAKGKTYAIAEKILSEIEKKSVEYLVISPSYKTFHDSFKGVLNDEKSAFYTIYKKCSFSESKIVASKEVYLRGTYGETIIHKRIFLAKNIEEVKSLGINPKYVFVDNSEFYDSIPTNTKEFGINCQAVFLMTSENNIKIINDDREIIDEKEWCNSEIQRLMNEFSGLSPSTNNTKTRESLLCVIDRLNHVRNNLQQEYYTKQN